MIPIIENMKTKTYEFKIILLKDFLKKNCTYLQQHYHISKIGLFGSFARNEQNKESDVDPLIEIEEQTQNIYELKNALTVYFKKSFGRDVDLAREKYLKPYAKNAILEETIYVF